MGASIRKLLRTGLVWRATYIRSGFFDTTNSALPADIDQLDIYFDSQTPLPWNYTDVVRDNMIDGQTSDSYLPRLSPSSKWWRYVDGINVPSQKGPVLPETRLQLRYLAAGALGTGLRLWLFDCEYEPGVMLLSYKNACPAFDGEGPGILNYYTQAELSRTRGVNPNSVHAVEIPSSYIKKIRAAYLEQKKPNDDVSRRIYEDFQRSRAAPQQTGDTR